MPESAANCWDVAAGLDAEFIVFPLDSGDRPAVFAGTETLVCQAWRGDDTTPTAGVAAAAWRLPDGTDEVPDDWPVDAPYVVVSILGTGTASSLESYRLLRVSAVAGGKSRELLTTWLHVGDSPGAADAPACYCTLQDMIDVGGGWLPKLMMESGRTDFLAERARATNKLRAVLLARWRPDDCIDLGSYDGTWDYSYGRPSKRLTELLDADGLILDGETRAAVACLAVAFACERSLTWEADDPMARRAVAFERRWRAALPGLSCGIDDDADGVANFWVDLSTISSR